MKVVKNVLEAHPIKHVGGGTMGFVRIHPQAVILWLGIDPIDSSIALWTLAPPKERPEEFVQLEFLVLQAGQAVPDGYLFRSVLLNAPPLFIFQKQPKEAQLIIPGGIQ